jgi:cell pole-organizing protein PopZ
MDDIVASIRRILHEDTAPGYTPGAVEDEVFDLNTDMVVSEPGATPGHAPVVPPAPPPAPLPEPPSLPEAHPPEASVTETVHAVAPEPVAPLGLNIGSIAIPAPASDTSVSQGLVAPEITRAAAAKVSDLVQRLVSERQTALHRGGPTIEDLIREMLRPLLKDWLDAHLPGIVERSVQTEIERVISRSLS